MLKNARIWTTGVTSLREPATYVYWEIGDSLPAGGTFRVERALSPAPEETWTALAPADTFDFYALDRMPLLYHSNDLPWYRVSYVMPDTSFEMSAPQQARGAIPARDYRACREIIRRESLGLLKGGGTQGWLSRRRTWGTPCPTCLTQGTGQPADPLCPTCFGTGYAGGYFRPMSYWVLKDSTTKLRASDQQGQSMLQQFQARALSSLEPQVGDIWSNSTDQQRYIISPNKEQISIVTEHRGIPLAYAFTLGRLPVSHPAYLAPLVTVGILASGDMHPEDPRDVAIDTIEEDIYAAEEEKEQVPYAGSPDTRPVF